MHGYKIIPYNVLRNFRCGTQDLWYRCARRHISRYSLKYVDTKEYLRFSGGIANSNDYYRKAREYLLDFPERHDKTSLERRLRSTRYHGESFGNRWPLLKDLTKVNDRNQAGQGGGIFICRGELSSDETIVQL